MVLWDPLRDRYSVQTRGRDLRVSINPGPAVSPNIERDIPSAAPQREAGRVLVVLTPKRTAARALQEAHDFAHRIGAELHVIRVVARAEGDPQGPPRDLSQAVRESHRVLAAARHARKLCDRVLQERLSGARICVRLGHLVEEVAQRAAELDARLIAVPRGTRAITPLVMELARRADCAVLVPRGSATFVGARLARRRSTPSTAAQLVVRSRSSILVEPLDAPWQALSDSASS